MAKNEEGMRKSARIEYDDMKVGDIMAFVSYGKITHKNQHGQDLRLASLDKGCPDFMVTGKPLIESGLSADRAADEVRVTKTQAAELLISSHNRPFTVVFKTQEDKVRTLRGRLVSAEPLLGRSHVEDFDITDAHRLRLVDHRTLISLVVNGIKYVVKS